MFLLFITIVLAIVVAAALINGFNRPSAPIPPVHLIGKSTAEKRLLIVMLAAFGLLLGWAAM